MRKVYLVPNVVTAFALACGLFVIFKMNMTEPGATNYQRLLVSAFILLIAGIADLLDGAIARFIHAESEFGGQFDSLSDGVTFGVAPSVVVLKTLSVPQGTRISFLVTAAAMVYSVCGILRLVRFNVDSSQNKANATSKNFTGLPIPAGAITVVGTNLFLESAECQQWFHFSESFQAGIMIAVMAIVGYFMVSRWKFPSSKTLHFRVRSFHLVFITVVIAVFFFFGALYFLPLLFVVVPWLYLIVAWVLSIIRLIAGKKSKTLEDFEPESDEWD